MTDRETAIVDAAISVIARYGIRRTTMNDIATEAGVARQTLYNVYANKEEVLRAAIRRTADLTLAGIREDTADTDSLPEQLDAIFEHRVVRMYRLLATMPDAEGLMSDTMAAGADVVAETEEQNRALIEEFLTPFADRLAANGMTPPGLADFIRLSLNAIKHDAVDEDHLHALLRTLKANVLTVTGASASLTPAGQAAHA